MALAGTVREPAPTSEHLALVLRVPDPGAGPCGPGAAQPSERPQFARPGIACPDMTSARFT